MVPSPPDPLSPRGRGGELEASALPVLEMRGISKRFPGVRALHNVSFDCWRGEVHALVGENGAGKSTLVKILAGAYQPDAGEIVLRGERLAGLTPSEAQRRGIAIIYQEFNLVPHMSVAENILLGREPRGPGGLIDRRALRARAAAPLARLGVALDLDAEVADLTVAQQQIVEIARALSLEAVVIVMDEPSAVLAGEELDHLFAVVRALRAHGAAVVYISHRLQEIFAIADRVTVLKDGERVGTWPVAEVDRLSLVRRMVGRPLDETFPPPAAAPGEAVLEVRGLTSADGFVREVSFTLRRGEILGVAGLVGAGRTTLARALVGAEPPTAGEVRLEGKPLLARSPAAAIAAGLVLVPEDRQRQGLLLGRSLRENVSLGVVDRLRRWLLIPRGAEQTAVAGAIRDLDIRPPDPGREVQFLSGGNQQKAVLARWLLTRPRVVVLDEPTRGIDVGAKFEIYALMRRLTAEGVAILMISSELPELLGMSDRILVMHEGRLMGELARGEASEETVMLLATGHPLAEVRGSAGSRVGGG